MRSISCSSMSASRAACLERVATSCGGDMSVHIAGQTARSRWLGTDLLDRVPALAQPRQRCAPVRGRRRRPHAFVLGHQPILHPAPTVAGRDAGAHRHLGERRLVGIRRRRGGCGLIGALRLICRGRRHQRQSKVAGRESQSSQIQQVESDAADLERGRCRGPPSEARPKNTIHLRPTAALAERVLLPGDPGRALALAQFLLESPLMFNHNRGLWGYTGVAADGEPLTSRAPAWAARQRGDRAARADLPGRDAGDQRGHLRGARPGARPWRPGGRARGDRRRRHERGAGRGRAHTRRPGAGRRAGGSARWRAGTRVHERAGRRRTGGRACRQTRRWTAPRWATPSSRAHCQHRPVLRVRRPARARLECGGRNGRGDGGLHACSRWAPPPGSRLAACWSSPTRSTPPALAPALTTTRSQRRSRRWAARRPPHSPYSSGALVDLRGVRRAAACRPLGCRCALGCRPRPFRRGLRGLARGGGFRRGRGVAFRRPTCR